MFNKKRKMKIVLVLIWVEEKNQEKIILIRNYPFTKCIKASTAWFVKSREKMQSAG